MNQDHSSEEFDVAIIGSGPAGTSAAIKLAKSGYNVVIFEKVKLPRYKPCGGGLVHKAINMLQVDFDSFVEKKCYSAEVYEHSNNLRFSVKRNMPIITMVMRDKFDFKLVTEAKKTGVVVKDEHEVIDAIQRLNRVELITSNGNYLSDFIVVANGATNITFRNFNIPYKIKKIPALECEISVRNEIYSKFNNSARFDLGIVPNGYCWVFPKKEHLSIGVLSYKNDNANLNEKLKEYLDLLDIGDKDIVKFEKHGFWIPINIRGKTFAKDRIILTGDAAGLADPLTSEGISSAILSGQIAADALIEGELNPTKVEKVFNEKIRSTMLREVYYARFISRIFYCYPRIRSFLMRRYGSKFCELLTDIFMGERTYSTLLKNPLNYFKLFTHIKMK